MQYVVNLVKVFGKDKTFFVFLLLCYAGSCNIYIYVHEYSYRNIRILSDKKIIRSSQSTLIAQFWFGQNLQFCTSILILIFFLPNSHPFTHTPIYFNGMVNCSAQKLNFFFELIIGIQQHNFLYNLHINTKILEFSRSVIVINQISPIVMVQQVSSAILTP